MTAVPTHRHTSHGHPCCDQAPTGGHTGLVARCGGPGLCGKCKTERDLIHTPADCRHEYPGAVRTRELNPGSHIRIVDCDLFAGHDGDHAETDTGVTWPQEGKPADAAYGELVLAHKMPTVVGEIPERTLMTVELLRSLNSAHLIGPDRICVGETADGELVLYRITGWSLTFSALVLTRCDR